MSFRAIKLPAVPAKAVFMNVLRDHRLSSVLVMGCMIIDARFSMSRETLIKSATTWHLANLAPIEPPSKKRTAYLLLQYGTPFPLSPRLILTPRAAVRFN